MEHCNIQRIFGMSETDRPRSLQPKEARRPEKSAEPSKSELTRDLPAKTTKLRELG